MGCCESSFLKETQRERDEVMNERPLTQRKEASTESDTATPTATVQPTNEEAPLFSEFSFLDLRAATNNFSSDNIVSESGEKAANVVYKGRLENRQWIAVKKFTKVAWPDPTQFKVTLMFFWVLIFIDLLCGFCVNDVVMVLL